MNRIQSRFTSIIRRSAAVGLATVALTTALVSARADSTPFSRIFVFGDSLCDTGNFHALTGGYPPPPYYAGRFSNGKLWVEQTAAALRMEILPGDNYAVAGATTGRDNVNDGLAGLQFPGLQDQIDTFEAQHSAADAGDALFVVWAGANDFFAALQSGTSPQVLIGNGVGNTAQAIVRLAQRGARHIMVVNAPDLGVTPYARDSGLSTPITQLCAAYNQYLNAALDSLAQAGIATIRVDAFSTLRTMATDPARFGFTNVTQAFLTTGGNADQFLFWDAVHPTTVGHSVLATEAVNQLVSYYSPSRGNGLPPARVNALHGLVQAASN